MGFNEFIAEQTLLWSVCRASPPLGEVRRPRSQPQTGVHHCPPVSCSSIAVSLPIGGLAALTFVVIFGLLIIFNNFLNKDFGISCLWSSFCFWNFCLLPRVFVQEAV